MKRKVHRRKPKKHGSAGFMIGLIALIVGVYVWWIHSTAETAEIPISSSVGEIPEQAIRLRILAHSDRPEDQWIKRRVRDELVKSIGTWKDQPRNIEEARSLIQSRMPELQRLASRTVKENGFDEQVEVTFGKVPFPTKLYGERLYPAGEYEALLVKIGDGKGENWWCVLFPPLCFIDMQNGDAIKPAGNPASFTASLGTVEDVYAAGDFREERPVSPEPLEVRFFLWDAIKEWFGE
ncbi:stage II sporulation protein R [Staphylospora marina]|uniref:stage II sporulation protein R n=1 Tax=Staphylospora marina TaxID=2490858 RepID=UPI001F15166F|nr:stage II sporulation protein R [Staphylospora marina]